ncbi:hypothetical protein MGU_10953 [Metarhizium guizhouense ARSEF 977]|uniref:Uncharacterized protein n=1 Tax=Metarhizium guizhouense (strain ARSEF 977) TaxID=1276136 RepID=A0A0B4GPN5_METGA|nr:hypothetical protein MGU_10953 [Metarhizium guizhouense ARSEF 977]
MASNISGKLQGFGGELAGRAASAACALTVLVLTAVTFAMKKDGEPLLESILIVSILGFLWNAPYFHPLWRGWPIYRPAVKLQVDRLLCVLWVASVPAMVTSYVYTKDNFRASKEGLFDIVRVLTVWSTVLGL